MKTHNKAKLLVLFPLVTLTFGCESKESKTAQNENTPTEVKEVVSSPLREQIQFMLAGKSHNETVLKAEVGKQEWKATFTILKEELAKYTVQHGKRPEKKNIAFAHSTLSLIKSEWKLAKAREEKKKALKSLEDTIQTAIKDEKSKKSSH